MDRLQSTSIHSHIKPNLSLLITSDNIDAVMHPARKEMLHVDV
jgi:hypothetical protein